MRISSPAFASEDFIPRLYTCDGEDINPPLIIKDVPPETKSLVLIVDDPDAPVGLWVHWVVWNIDPGISEIKAGSVPAGGVVGVASGGRPGWDGICPPQGTHRYFFKIYALTKKLELPPTSTKEDVLQAMIGAGCGSAELMGRYQR